MAAVSATGDEIVQFELNHYIHGYHDYMDIWTPYTYWGNFKLHSEPSNSKDPHAVVVMSSDIEVVGHVPVLFSRAFSKGMTTMAAVKLLVKGSIVE